MLSISEVSKTIARLFAGTLSSYSKPNSVSLPITKCLNFSAMEGVSPKAISCKVSGSS